MAFVVCIATWLAAASALAQSRGPLVILGLRAPDGDDEAAANATAALRRAARNAGFDVPNDSPALEQEMASFGCDDSLPADCLAQISGDLHAEHMVYGAVRRHGRGASAQLAIQVNRFEGGSRTVASHAETEVARAAAQDADALNNTARHLIDQIEPPPAAGTQQTTTTTQTGTTGNQSTSTMTTTTQTTSQTTSSTPSSPTPVRRYAGLAVMGVGVVTGIIGLVFGIQWLSLNSTNQATGSVWLSYMPPGGGSTVGFCEAAQNTSNDAVGTYNRSFTQLSQVQQSCSASATDSTLGWTLGGIGIGLIAIGGILFLTDHTGQETPPQDQHASARRPMHWNVAPVVSPGYSGASFQLQF